MMMFMPPQSSSSQSFPINALVNEVMNQVVLNNCFQDDNDSNTTTKSGNNDIKKKKCHSKQHRCCGSNSNKNKKKPPCNLVLEKKPMHHEDTAEYAKVSFDVVGFTDADINIQIDEENNDSVVAITGERTNALGDVFRIDRKFRLDKKTADVDEIDATITADGILEIVVKKKKKVGPRVIKITTSPTITVTDDDSTKSSSNEQELGNQNKNEAIETDNDDNDDDEEEEEKKEKEITIVITKADDEDKKEAKMEPTKSDDDSEYEQIWKIKNVEYRIKK